MKTEKEQHRKIYKLFITTIIIIIIGALYTENEALAYGTWQGNATSGMPQQGQYSPTGGLLPQILQNRTFSGDADTEFPYGPWSTSVSSGTVYCADSGKALRFGEFDSKLHYADEGLGAVFGVDYINYNTYKLMMTALCQKIGKEVYDNINKPIGTRNWQYLGTFVTNIGYKQIQGPTYYDDIYNIDTSKPIVVTKAQAQYGDGETSYNYTKAELASTKIVKKIFASLSKWERATTTEDKSTNMRPWEQDYSTGLSPINGPQVVIMETEDRAEDGYKQKGNTKTATNFTSSKGANIAYILTAMENAYTGVTGYVRNKYNLADIQTAYWEAVDFDGISKEHETNEGLKLFNKAKD